MTKKNRFQQGATLVEILVAVLVLSLGLLGMAGMQMRALKGNHSSTQRTHAVMMSYYILDAMRVDRDSAKSQLYNTGALVNDEIGPICNSAAVTGATLASNNLRQWIQAMKTAIGETSDTTTCGGVLCDADGLCRVQVRWDDTRAGGLGAQIVDIRTRL